MRVENNFQFHYYFIQFGYYDPFVNVGQFNLSNVDEWGIFHCMPISSMDFNDNWLVQKEYSLNNFPLVFTIFERYPTMVKNLPPYFADTFYNGGMKFSGYGGIDGLLLGNLAQELQFEVETIEPSDDKTYGHKKKTGTFTGTIADILYGDADAAFNGRFFLEYGTRKIEFLLPVLGDKVCIIAPGAEKIPQWIAIFKCFDVYFWCTFAIITLLSSLCFFVLKVWQEKHEMAIIRQSLLYQEFKQHVVEDEGNFKDIFFITWKVMVGITANMPFGSMERLFIGSCLLANLIISGTFEVNIIADCISCAIHFLESNQFFRVLCTRPTQNVPTTKTSTHWLIWMDRISKYLLHRHLFEICSVTIRHHPMFYNR